MVNVIEIKKKIAMIGDAAVGKTSLIRRCVLDQFSDDYIATFGTKITKKHVKFDRDNNEIIDIFLMIWDVMGQEEFKRAQMQAYSDSRGAIIVCDVTRKDTLLNVLKWYSDILSVTQDIPVIILANKYDLKEQAEVTTEDLDIIASQLDAKSFFTSARTGDNVETAFRELGRQLI
jgi:small GTP-binding protein